MSAAPSLLFLPDISGYTKFVQTTEAEHSQHVIAELLEVLLEANTEDLSLAEIEGDALFFYKEGEIPSQEKLLSQVETMFTAFYSHLKSFEKNRICPCNACAKAPDLQLKIVAHSGPVQFLQVKSSRKPFGAEVIEAHRLLKNSVKSDNYTLLSEKLAKNLSLPISYSSKLFSFKQGIDIYDGKEVPYIYSLIDPSSLKLNPFPQSQKVVLNWAPNLELERDFPVSAESLLEYITNYKYRHHWLIGVDSFEYDENEVTRLGSEHICVINGKRLNIKTVTKEAAPGQYVYGEMSADASPLDILYQFYLITPLDENSSLLKLELYWKTRSPIKKLLVGLFGKRSFKKTLEASLEKLAEYVE